MADLLMGRSGDAVSGKVLLDPIGFKSGFGTFEFRRKDIGRIHVDVPHGHGPDEIGRD